MAKEELADIRKAFDAAVNMTPGALSEWLETDDSKSVGWKGKDGKADESVGHKSGRRIVAIRRKHPAELEPEDYAHMKRVVGFVRRHTAQRPTRNIETSRWRYSLMNWGHDPLKR
jgi:hypothetical protein